MSKTLALVGAGPGLSLSIAQRFGREGFKVGLVARRRESLEHCAAALADAGVEAAAFQGDATDPASLEAALAGIAERLGPIDAFVWTVAEAEAGHAMMRAPTETTLENTDYWHRYTRGFVAAAQFVLPGMLARGDGALLFVIGGSGRFPLYTHASPGMWMAAVRMFSRSLYREVADKGVYSGVLTVAGPIAPGTDIDPGEIADIGWDMVSTRDRDEDCVGDVEYATARWG